MGRASYSSDKFLFKKLFVHNISKHAKKKKDEPAVEHRFVKWSIMTSAVSSILIESSVIIALC